jgi:hypothetical protein
MTKVEIVARERTSRPDGYYSDEKLAAVLAELNASTGDAEIRLLSDQIERAIFYRQFESA